jgi:ankyrin repeat protein
MLRVVKKKLERSLMASDIDAVLEQIRSGADVNSRNRRGQTALMLAATRGDGVLTKLLIYHGADLNVTTKYRLSALMLAVVNNHEEVVRLLCEAGADLELTGTGAPGFTSFTALDLAERASQTRIAEIIRAASMGAGQPKFSPQVYAKGLTKLATVLVLGSLNFFSVLIDCTAT